MNSLITTEEVRALYFDPRALTVPSYKLYRISTPKGRFYFTFDSDSMQPILYLGVTTMIAKLVPKDEHLIKWIADMGYVESKRYATERAFYGTLFHREAAKFLINREYNLDLVDVMMDAYLLENNLKVDVEVWREDLKKDMITFCQWCYDYNVVPLAIEIMLVHPDGYAGTIDLVCELDIHEKGFWGEVFIKGDRKGEPKETTRIRRGIAAVDFKSGRKGFYTEHEIQLESYRSLVEVNFPSIRIEKIYNWRPTDWRESPKYAFKDQSLSIDKEKFDALISMAKIELLKQEHVYSDIVGTLHLGTEPIGNIANLNISEYIILKMRDIIKE